jgi:hypothetical protein
MEVSKGRSMRTSIYLWFLGKISLLRPLLREQGEHSAALWVLSFLRWDLPEHPVTRDPVTCFAKAWFVTMAVTQHGWLA